MKLSLCIATFNEEKNIHYPLDSAYDLVDEVVIVDGGSTDRTVEVAKSYGKKVKVFLESNPSMFHINKQKALDRAGGQWILQLDADEALSNELQEEIRNLLSHDRNFSGTKLPASSAGQTTGSSKFGHFESSVAYWIPRKNWFLDRFLKKGGQYPDYTIRLYKNGVARFPCKDVHENVLVTSGVTEDRIDSSIGYLKNPILHYADPDFSRYLTRWNRYTSLDADILIKKGEKPCLPCYFVTKPIATFFSIYFRHLGLVDGFSGFVFALFSAIRYWTIYVKWWQRKKLS